MSSSNTMRYAEDESEKAKAIQRDIESHQMKISELRKDVVTGVASQSDVDNEQQIISSLQQKQNEHLADAQRLSQKAVEEQKQEQQEELRNRQDNDSLGKKTAKSIAKGGLFGL